LFLTVIRRVGFAAPVRDFFDGVGIYLGGFEARARIPHNGFAAAQAHHAVRRRIRNIHRAPVAIRFVESRITKGVHALNVLPFTRENSCELCDVSARRVRGSRLHRFDGRLHDAAAASEFARKISALIKLAIEALRDKSLRSAAAVFCTGSTKSSALPTASARSNLCLSRASKDARRPPSNVYWQRADRSV
jgi:hypothetical protein